MKTTADSYRSRAALVAAMFLISASCGTATPTPRRSAPPAPAPAAKAPGPDVPFFAGLGEHDRKVSTTSPEAQRYFSQGLAFVYAFNHDEAIHSFERAALLDPQCAMAHWGVALANGPHINYPAMDERHTRAAAEAVVRARAASAFASPVERALIDALSKRYVLPRPRKRQELDRAYADAMRAVSLAHPRDVDVLALFAESLMDVRPWDLWTHDGEAQPGTSEILVTLENALRLDPNHPLANHLYIHAVEASPFPEKGDASADRLRELAPGLGHLLHMSSHIDVRRGRWRAAAVANERAIAADADYRRQVPRQDFYNMYMAHNGHMLAYSAMMRGQSEKAIAAVRTMVADMPADWVRANTGIADGYVAMGLEVLMRFGRWEEILTEPEPPEFFPITRTMRLYARGVAFGARRRFVEAKAAQEAFIAASKSDTLRFAFFGSNGAPEVLAIAEHLLAGELHYFEGDRKAGLAELREAVRREDALHYNEPPDWIQPVRHALGAALVRADLAAEAEAVYREDLRRAPENGWSLFGLATALRMQNKRAGAAQADARFATAWADADVELSSSCFCQPGI